MAARMSGEAIGDKAVEEGPGQGIRGLGRYVKRFGMYPVAWETNEGC